MIRRCPLAESPEGSILFAESTGWSVCFEQCFNSFNNAVKYGVRSGEYDLYDSEEHKKNCPTAEDSELEYSHDAIQKAIGAARLYSIVDLCTACETEVGEQAYYFTCPFDEDPLNILPS